MKIRTALTGCILGAAALLVAMPPTARADSGPTPMERSEPAAARPDPAIQPGTDAESRQYAQREADSPEARDFKGGGVVGLVVLILVVVLIVFLIQNG